MKLYSTIDKKGFELIIGTIIGIAGFLYSINDDNGQYNVGIPIVFEFLFIFWIAYVIFNTNDKLALISLQALLSWHVASIIREFLPSKQAS
tara:strand:- start:403 stop:675 length:273 start_codon:yes stop_codon:yes gene_type:complete